LKKLAAYTKPDYAPGATRLKRVFAFKPTYVAGYIVWLSFYEVLQGYIEQQYRLRVEGAEKGFVVGEWKDISKRII
jgi:hypothetical protein